MAEGSKSSSRAPPKRRGPIAKLLALPFQIALWLFLSLCSAVLVDVMAMTLLWPEQGASFARRELIEELSYLHRDFHAATSAWPTPAEAVGDVLMWIRTHLFPETAMETLRYRLGARTGEYLLSIAYSVQMFAVRVSVIVLSAPAFLLFGAWAILEGLVRRDLRRFHVGHESSWLFHYTKSFTKPLLTIPGAVYLAIPVSVHPTLVFVPFLALFTLNLLIAAATWKKYL